MFLNNFWQNIHSILITELIIFKKYLFIRERELEWQGQREGESQGNPR